MDDNNQVKAPEAEQEQKAPETGETQAQPAAPQTSQYAPPEKQTTLGLDENIASMISYITGVWGYIGLVFNIVMLVLEKKSKAFRFNIAQSLIYNGCVTVVYILIMILKAVFNTIFPPTLKAGGLFLVKLSYSPIWHILNVLNWIIVVGSLALMVLCAVRAYSKKETKLPVIGDIAAKIANK